MGEPDRQDVLNQACNQDCNHKHAYLFLDFFVKPVVYFDKNDKTIWSDPFFPIRKNIVHVRLQPLMPALFTSRLG